MKSEWLISPSQSWSRSASCVQLAPGVGSGNGEYGFLPFLAAVQMLEIDFLPIIWDAARQGLGSGATSTVDEWLVDLKTSFAFKRVHSSSKRARREVEIYRTLINEISVLGHPSVRENLYIAQLLGICWDVSSDDITPWPVLVFEKSQFGDLYHFMTQSDGRSMGIKERIALFVDIGTAIRDMHSKGIIHGDIKPHNVLVFKNAEGGYVAKVIDFGPWNAPEHDRLAREWSVHEAKKIDIFSFGMLCLWLLFEPYCSGCKPVPGGFDWTFGFQPPSQSLGIMDFLNKLKLESKILAHAQNLLDIETASDTRQRADVWKLLSSTLNSSAERIASIDPLLHKLEPERRVNVSHDVFIMKPNPQAADFQILKSMRDLYFCDYRVRPHIAQHLISEHRRNGSLAFDVAVCHSVGFGVPRDTSRAALVLSQGSLDIQIMENAISACLATNHLVQTPRLEELLNADNVTWTSFAEVYFEQGKLNAAEIQLQRERKDMLEMFSCENTLTVYLGIIILAIYVVQARWNDVQQMTAQLLEFAPESLEDRSFIRADLLTYLGNSLLRQHQLREAEDKQLQALHIQKRILREDHPTTLGSTSNLATTYRAQARWQEAEHLYVHVLERRTEVLGLSHPAVLAGMSRLALLYYDQGLHAKAEETLLETITLGKMVLGENHHEVLSRMSDLAVVYGRRFRWKEAENIILRVVKAREQILGEEHPYTLDGMSVLAETYAAQGRWKSAEEVDRQASVISGRKLGPSHPHTLLSMVRLADRYHKLGRGLEAEELGERAMNLGKSILGMEHHATVEIMATMAQFYAKQARWDKAQPIRRDLLAIREQTLGLAHPSTLTEMVSVAETCIERGQMDEAEILLTRERAIAKEVFGERHSATWRSTKRLVHFYMLQGLRADAESIVAHEADIIESLLKEKHNDTLASIIQLAEIYSLLRHWHASEATNVLLLEMSKNLLGVENEITLNTMLMIAKALRMQDREEQAKNMEAQAAAVRQQVWGLGHSNTLKDLNRLARSHEDEGRWQEATNIMTQVVEERRKAGGSYEDTAQDIGYLIWLYQGRGRLHDAEILQVQLNESTRAALGENHPDTLSGMANMTAIYRAQHRWEDAARLEESVLRISKTVRGGEHPLTLSSMANLNTTYEKQGKWRNVEEVNLQILKATERAKWDDHLNIHLGLKCLAMAYRGQNRLSEAETAEARMRKWRNETLGREIPRWALNLGISLYTWIHHYRLGGIIQFVKRLYTKGAKLDRLRFWCNVRA